MIKRKTVMLGVAILLAIVVARTTSAGVAQSTPTVPSGPPIQLCGSATTTGGNGQDAGAYLHNPNGNNPSSIWTSGNTYALGAVVTVSTSYYVNVLAISNDTTSPGRDSSHWRSESGGLVNVYTANGNSVSNVNSNVSLNTPDTVYWFPTESSSYTIDGTASAGANSVYIGGYSGTTEATLDGAGGGYHLLDDPGTAPNVVVEYLTVTDFPNVANGGAVIGQQVSGPSSRNWTIIHNTIDDIGGGQTQFTVGNITTTSGSATVTTTSSFSSPNIHAGNPATSVRGPGIPAGSYVSAVNTSTSITISNAATATSIPASTTVTFGSGGGGGAINAGTEATIQYNCLANNAEDGINAAGGGAIGGGENGVTVTYNEFDGNGTDLNNGVCGGCDAAIKMFDAHNSTISDNYVHSDFIGIWPDTNNAGLTIQGNYIANEARQAIWYENSYNAQIDDNTLVDDSWMTPTGGAGYPDGSIYISSSGADPRLAAECPVGVAPPCGPTGSGYAPNLQGGSPITTFTVTNNQLYDDWGGVQVWNSANDWCGGADGSGGQGGNQCALGAISSAAVMARGCASNSTTLITGCSTTAGVVAGMLVAGKGIPLGDTVASVAGGTVTLTSATDLTASSLTLAFGGSANPARLHQSSANGGAQCGATSDCSGGWTSSCTSAAISASGFSPTPPTTAGGEASWYADELYWNCNYRATAVQVSNNTFNLTPADITPAGFGGGRVCGAGTSSNTVNAGSDGTLATAVKAGSNPNSFSVTGIRTGLGIGTIVDVNNGTNGQEWIVSGSFGTGSTTIPVFSAINGQTQNALYAFGIGSTVSLGGTECGTNDLYGDTAGSFFGTNIDSGVTYYQGNRFSLNTYCGPWSWKWYTPGEFDQSSTSTTSPATWQAVSGWNFSNNTSTPSFTQDFGSTFNQSGTGGCVSIPTTTTTGPTTTSTSPTTSTTTPVSMAPGAVVGLIATVNGSSVTLNWTNPVGSDGASVFRDGALVYSPSLLNPEITTFEDDAVATGQHQYTVVAWNIGGKGPGATVTVEVPGAG